MFQVVVGEDVHVIPLGIWQDSTWWLEALSWSGHFLFNLFIVLRYKQCTQVCKIQSVSSRNNSDVISFYWVVTLCLAIYYVLYTVQSNFHTTPKSDIFIAYFTSEEPSPPGQLSGCTRIQTDHKAHITQCAKRLQPDAGDETKCSGDDREGYITLPGRVRKIPHEMALSWVSDEAKPVMLCTCRPCSSADKWSLVTTCLSATTCVRLSWYVNWD